MISNLILNKRSVVHNFNIYFLFNKDDIVYIGRTKRLEDRILAHKKGDFIFDSYSVLEVDEEDFSDLEKYYIFKYKPMYNKKFPTETWYKDYQSLVKSKYE